MSLENATTSAAPLTSAEQISVLITELQQEMQKQSPGYELLLHRIHKQLSADEELVHLLKDEEIGVIVAGLSKKKGLILAEAATKGRKASQSAKALVSDLSNF